MDYEKEYKEAFLKAKNYLEGKYGYNLKDTPYELFKFIFPEIENKNEKIKRCVLDIIKEHNWNNIFGVTKAEVVEWLNRIKINTPQKIEDEDERVKNALYTKFNTERKQGASYNIHGVSIDDIINWLERQEKVKCITKVVPKFKVGDILFNSINEKPFTVEEIRGGCYIDNKKHIFFPIIEQDKLLLNCK